MLGVLGFQLLQQSDGFGDGGGIVLGPGLGQAAQIQHQGADQQADEQSLGERCRG